MKPLIILLFVLLSHLIFAQTAPELGPNSLTLPRLTAVQRNTLSPAKGHIIFNTTSNQMEYYELKPGFVAEKGTVFKANIGPGCN
jgi:hypothetical protein